jgi:hypothetical protein
MPDDIDPNADVISGRKILDRMEELESEHWDPDTDETIPRERWDVDANNEWVILSDLVEEIGEQACRNGVTLIRESYFRDYVKDEYREIGGEYYEAERPYGYAYVRIPSEELYRRSPFNHIDWDAVAEDERSGYSIVEYNDVTYYYQEP